MEEEKLLKENEVEDDMDNHIDALDLD